MSSIPETSLLSDLDYANSLSEDDINEWNQDYENEAELKRQEQLIQNAIDEHLPLPDSESPNYADILFLRQSILASAMSIPNDARARFEEITPTKEQIRAQYQRIANARLQNNSYWPTYIRQMYGWQKRWRRLTIHLAEQVIITMYCAMGKSEAEIASLMQEWDQTVKQGPFWTGWQEKVFPAIQDTFLDNLKHAY